MKSQLSAWLMEETALALRAAASGRPQRLRAGLKCNKLRMATSSQVSCLMQPTASMTPLGSAEGLAPVEYQTEQHTSRIRTAQTGSKAPSDAVTTNARKP